MFNEWTPRYDTPLPAHEGPLRRLAALFRAKEPAVSYDMLFKDARDGCARYDDVWGG